MELTREIFVAVTLVLAQDSPLTAEQVRTELQHHLEDEMEQFGITKVCLSKGLDLEYPK